jgi:hypothetical protein
LDSNLKVRRELHSQKHIDESSRTEDGRRIEESDEHCENACSSICERCDPASNVTVESNGQEEKQNRPIVITAEGIQIDESLTHAKAL